MVYKLAYTLRHIAVILVAVGVVTLGAYAFSTSSLASSLSGDHGRSLAAMMTMTDQSVTASDIVLVDNASAAVASDIQAEMQRPIMREGGPGGGSTQGLILIAKNVGIMLAVSTVVAVIQTVSKRRKRSQKLKRVPA